MGYSSITYTAPTNGGQLIQNTLDTLLLGAGWTSVATHTSGTIVSNIYKSAGTLNSFGQDFYLLTQRQSVTDSSCRITIFEQWDSVNTKLLKYCPWNSAGLTPAADYSVPDVVGVLPSTLGSSVNFSTITLPNTGTTVVSIKVDIDKVYGFGSAGCYAGLFDSFLTSDPFPLCVANLIRPFTSTSSAATQTQYIGYTREPNQTAVDVNNWTGAVPYLEGQAIYGIANGNSNGVELYTQKFSVWRGSVFASLRAYGILNGATENYAYTAFRGLPKDIILTGTSGNGGDTLTFTQGATTYNYFGLTSYSAIGSAFAGSYGCAIWGLK